MFKGELSLDIYYGTQIDIRNPHIMELMTDGYGFDTDKLSDDFGYWRARKEYHLAQVVYIVKNNSVEIATLGVNPRSNTTDDPFWKELQLRRPDLSDPHFLACYIQGIVVHRTLRKKGIGSDLLRTMIDYYQPQVIFGQTKTPQAVAIRSNVLREFNYRSFYGFYEVTPGNQPLEDEKGYDFVYAAFVSEEKMPSETGVYLVDPNILPSYLPDVTPFSPQIQRAFVPVIEAQEKIGSLKSVATVLVSVKDNLL